MDKASIVAEVEMFSKLGALRVNQQDQKKAVKAYRHAFQSALLLGYKGYMQRACAFNLGAIYVSSGNYTEGLTYLKLAEPPEGCHDGISNGDLYFNYGLAYEGLRNAAEMKAFYGKALKEYQTEKNNVKMEAEVICRLGKVCVMSDQYYEAESYVRQLIKIYEKLEDRTKQIQTQVEHASLLLRVDKMEEAEKIADHCFMRVQDKNLTNKTAHIFIELSLIYTQLCNYQKALQCCQSALQIVTTQEADLQQTAVLYQNLGAIYNYLGQYQEAIQYHQAAAKKYAEANNRKSQGHCFMNLGFAYSQLKDITRAGEYYLHSLQAAKDCGDKKSEWQSLEALGSVSSHQGDLKRSQDYYKSALTVLAKSPDAEDIVAQDRILEKITQAIKMTIHKQDDPVDTAKQEEDINPILPPVPHRTHKELLEKARRKEGSVIAVKKDGKVKYLRVRRSGTLQRFNKVALGLDVDGSPVPGQQGNFYLDIEEGKEEVFSATTIYFSESDEDNEIVEINETYRDIDHKRQPQRIREVDEETSIEIKTDSEDDDKSEVYKAMKGVIDQEDEGITPLQMEETSGTDDDVPDEPQQARLNQGKEKSEDDSEDYTEDEDSSIQNMEDEEETKQKQIYEDPPEIPPPLKSGSLGRLRTYEVPVKSEVLTNANSGGNNFFSFPDDEPLIRNNSVSKGSKEETMKKSTLAAPVATNPIYESIRQSSSEYYTDSDVEDSSASHLSKREATNVWPEEMPRGERDKLEYYAFQAEMKARRDKETRPEMDKKCSRICRIM